MTHQPARYIVFDLALPVLIFLALAAYYQSIVGRYVIDDAYIFFRYAENLADGFGLTWNRGGELVEGYTSFLWVIWLSLFIKLGFDPLLIGKISGVVFSLATLILTALAGWKLLELEAGRDNTAASAAPRWCILLALLYLATNRTFAGWAIEAMDGKLFQLSLIAAWYAWLVTAPDGVPATRFPWIGMLFALAVLARPEGWMFAGLAALLQIEANRNRRNWHGFYVNLGVFLLIAGGHLLWRMHTYGDWAPNTFRAKIPGAQYDKGAAYLVALFRENRLWLAAPLVVLGCGKCWRGALPQSRYLAYALLLYFYYLLTIGGDFFEFRFFDPILPYWVIALCLGLGASNSRLEKFSATARRNPIGACAILLLLLNSSTVIFPPRASSKLTTFEDSKNYTWQFGLAAHWLAHNIPPSRTLALTPAGIIPYITQAQVIDMLGLNDRAIARLDNVNTGVAIAHQRNVTNDYLIGRGADYIIGHPRLASGPSGFGNDASVELRPGLYFSFTPVRSGMEFEPGRVYSTAAHKGIQSDWPLHEPK